MSEKTSKPSGNTCKVSDKDFIFGRLLGEGSFSNVYLAQHIHTKVEYAIKTCEKFLIKKEDKIKSVHRERDVMNILNNNQDPTAPFFVKLSYAFQCNTYLYFVMTYCKNGELLKWIKKVGNFDRKSASFYAAEIVKALEHLHSLNIIHRDLKPENIILDENMHIKITDFGSAKILTNEDKDRRSSFVGTAQYVSPEVLETREVTRTADLWALGCIIYQMISGLPPFNDPSEYLIIKAIQKLDYKFPAGFDLDAKDLVQKFLILEKEKRLGAQDGDTYTSIRSHPFFEDLDFDTLYLETPPEICPYMPDLEDSITWDVNMPRGLIPEVIQRIEFNGTAMSPSKKPEEGVLKLVKLNFEDHGQRLAEQEENNAYHDFVDGHLIVKQGLLDKRKGLFPRRRMFLLTTGPKLYYVDPVNMVLKGEVPMDASLRPDPKDFKTFCLHTPNRTYYLEDPSGSSNEWCEALEVIRDHYFGNAT